MLGSRKNLKVVPASSSGIFAGLTLPDLVSPSPVTVSTGLDGLSPVGASVLRMMFANGIKLRIEGKTVNSTTNTDTNSR